MPALAVPVALVAGPGEARARLRRLAIVLLPVVVLLGTWTLRTATRLDAVVPLTTNSGTLLAGANCDEVFRGPRTGQWSLRCATASLPDPITDEAAAAASMQRAGLRYAGGHAERLPAVATVRVLRTFGCVGRQRSAAVRELRGPALRLAVGGVARPPGADPARRLGCRRPPPQRAAASRWQVPTAVAPARPDRRGRHDRRCSPTATSAFEPSPSPGCWCWPDRHRRVDGRAPRPPASRRAEWRRHSSPSP